jgi:thiol-disulfide isomerase/thioredoxin
LGDEEVVGVATADIQKAAEHSGQQALRKVEINAADTIYLTLDAFAASLMSAFCAEGCARVRLNYRGKMRRLIWVMGALILVVNGKAADAPSVEQQVLEAVKSPQVTVVHLWAPWCPNCKAELAEHGWSNFLGANPEIRVIFVTVWAGEKGDGRATLEQYGVGTQENFELLMHPNSSRKKDDKMTEFLGMPVTWIPTTWVFRDGTLRYALNYGELRFPMLQQMVRDTAEKWEH